MPVGAFVPSRIHLDYPEWQAPLIGNVGQVWAYDGTGYVPTSFLLSSAVSAYGATLIDDADAATARTTLGLGTAATLNVGTSANNIVQLDSSARLPAVDGSQLTGITAAAAGSTTQVIYNASGVYAGDAGMTYNASTDRLTVAGGLVAGDWSPPSDSTTAFSIWNAARSARVVTVDTTNGRLNLHDTSPAASATPTIIENDADPSNASVSATFIYGTPRLYLGKSGASIYALNLQYCGQIENPPTINWSGSAVMVSNGSISLFERSGNDILIHNGTFFQRILFNAQNAATNTISNCYHFRATNSGTPAPGFGVAIRVGLKSSTTADQDAGRLSWEWVSATHASRASRGKLTAYYTSTEQEAMTWDGDTGGLKLGFYGVTPVARQLLATGASATVDDVITALQNLGLLKQS